MTSKLSPIVLCLLVVLTVNPTFAQDNWLGGTGNWSNGADWSAGEPVLGSDVMIYSGGNDNVTLDVGANINSLMLGGPTNGFISELTDGGSPQTLTITTFLTVGQNGQLVLSGASNVTAGTFTNSGTVNVGGGASLNLTGQPGGITDVVAGSSFGIAGSFTAGLNSAFANLTSIEGQVTLSGQNDTIAPNGGTLTNSGNFGIGGGSTVSITGDMLNSGVLGTNYFVGGSNDTLNVSGILTNSGQVFLQGSGDVANLGTLANSGTVHVANGSTLNVAGNVTNSNYMYTNGGAINITGGLTNSGSFNLNNPGDSASMQTLANTGGVSVNTGASLNLSNQPGGITDVVAGSSFGIAGSFTAGLNSAFANLTSIEGQVTLSGQNDTIAPNGGTLTNSGNFGIGGGSTVGITGDMLNSGVLGTNYFVGGSNDTLNVSGILTNSGQVFLQGSGDVANLGTLANSGTVHVANGSTLNVAGNVTNSNYMYTNGGAINITGGLTNSGSFNLNNPGDSASMQTLAN